jgi:hypothetical protein
MTDYTKLRKNARNTGKNEISAATKIKKTAMAPTRTTPSIACKLALPEEIAVHATPYGRHMESAGATGRKP